MSDEVSEGLTFILPVCNQAPALEPALAAWARAIAELKRPFEILVVDDGSVDGTADTLSRLAGGADAPNPLARLRVLRHETRQGFGASLRTAVAEAKHPLLFYSGLDYDYSPGDLKKFVERAAVVDPELRRQADLVNGFRSRLRAPAWLRLIAWLWRTFMHVVVGYPSEPPPGWLGWRAWRYRLQLRILFGVRIRDVDSKFKLLRRNVFDRFSIQSDGEFVHAEIIAKVNFLGSLMDELPVAEKPGPYPAVAAPPAASPAVSAEMRQVFRTPVFVPAPAPTEAAPGTGPGPAAASPIEIAAPAAPPASETPPHEAQPLVTDPGVKGA